MTKKRKNGPKRRDEPSTSLVIRNPSRPRPPAEAIEERLSPQDLEITRKARQITDKALQKWLHEAEANARRPHKDLSHVPLIDQLDPWQREAFDALLNGEHVIVDAPTTAGKTRVVEAFFEINIDQPRFRAAYTTPVKSLSNDKLREFSDTFGKENVGIATGDIKENLSAPIVVATLESYRNSLLGVEPDLGRTLVVFDEYHFMQDGSRGSAWEEAIILTPPTCQLLLLSASVENPEQFCAWITAISGRRCRLIQTRERPVPLVDLVYFHEQWLLVSEVEANLPKKSNAPARFPLEHGEIARRLKSIPSQGLTPCIIYAGRRASCENMALELCKQLDPIPPADSQRIRELIENDAEVDDPMKFIQVNLRRLLLVYGVGYHHSGLAPYARRAIEKLVKNGQLRFCVATMGLSIGINFSVRSTLISDYTRPGESGFTTYAPSEVLQMLGRAGRRGKDVVGFSLWPSVAAWQKFGGTRRDRCESRLKNDPTTFLGLLGRGFKLRDVENFYEKSFLRFGDKSVRFSLIREQPLKKSLSAASLPCGASPASAFADFLDEKPDALCLSCPLREPCHAHIHKHMASSLAHLHLHLHRIGCIDESEQLTRYGSIARYFPQSGGLLMAQLIDQGDVTMDNLLAGLELMAALCLTRFKEPDTDRDYDFPFVSEKVEERLEELYPVELFEELYDAPGQRRDSYVFREYNPLAGSILSDWARGMSWADLVRKTTDERFGQGDLMALIYRAATYLQSLSQARIPGLGRAAASLRDQILREPLMPSSHRLVEEDDEESELLA
ncbi:MAG TPA: DEAD/DEAH box helicase [Oligoflexus sp.]|uniref:DEAD/DEAH box helicase n=1 Tax=Oligoflexus sp. TaxID=1971216 RepID=UPI002D354041|nr:DEAD/DEAH box helicase [Oligoflexus sp.]HYX33081.1 DEAD/DEAH box helicase [Oligoflexus sp.]